MFNTDKRDLKAAMEQLSIAMEQLTIAFEIINFEPKLEYLEKEYGPNYINYTKECNLCGEKYDSVRIHAAYCSSTCRSRMYRQKALARQFIDKNIITVAVVFFLSQLEEISMKPLQKRSRLVEGEEWP